MKRHYDQQSSHSFAYLQFAISVCLTLLALALCGFTATNTDAPNTIYHVKGYKIVHYASAAHAIL